jgi:hypothetical protein
MNAIPKTVLHVYHARNAGWPTEREFYGHGVIIVVVGVTPHQGDGNTECRAKGDRWNIFK